MQLERRDFVSETTQPATAEAFFEADLGAKVTGHVSELAVDIGARVKAGQTLARISVPELVEARNAAAADVTALRSARERTAALVEHKSVTERALVEAQTRLDAAIARQAGAEAELDYTLIKAPFDGVVTLRTIDPGDMVYQASSPKGKAEPLLRVAKLDVIRVKTFVPELDVEMGRRRRRGCGDVRRAARARVQRRDRTNVRRARSRHADDAGRDRSAERRRRDPARTSTAERGSRSSGTRTRWRCRRPPLRLGDGAAHVFVVAKATRRAART